MNKLVVIFPGLGYGVDAPLLYYADFLFETKGYDRIYIDYNQYLQDTSLTIPQRLNRLRQYELDQLKSICWSKYDTIVFLSKSIGSMEAGWIADQLHLPVKHIFLTPIVEAMPYCTPDTTVIMGTNDRHYSAYQHHTPSLYFPEADHSLEVKNDPLRSVENLKEYLLFLDQML